MTRVAPGTSFDGKISGGTDVWVEGALSGEVELGATLTVGARGKVDAIVRAQSVRIAGELFGDVRVDDRLEIQPGGRLEGDVHAPRVAIAQGGFFRGRIDMGSGRSETAQRESAGDPTANAAGGDRAPGAAATDSAVRPPGKERQGKLPTDDAARSRR